MDFKGLLDDETLARIDKDAGLQQALALMAASGPSLMPTNLGSILLQGNQVRDQSRQQGLQGAMQRQQLLDQRRQQEQMRNIAGMFSPGNAQAALAGGGGPTVANAQRMGQPMGAEQAQRALLAAIETGDPKIIEYARSLKDTLMPVFKTQSVQELMVGEKLKKFAVGEDGTMRELGVAPEKLIQVDAGGQKLLVSENTGKEINKFAVTMDPSQRAQASIGFGNLALRRQELANAQSPQSKAPAGYRFKTDGSLEAIPGGPADEKATMAGQKTAMRNEMSGQSALNVINTVKEAKDLVGSSTAGFGSLLAKIPESDARNLQAKLDTIKGNLGFDRLQQMREASPTGGALGAVAVQELVALQSTVASLDQAQSPSQLKASLDKIERHYNNWYKTTQGELPKGTEAQPTGGTVDFNSLPKGR